MDINELINLYVQQELQNRQQRGYDPIGRVQNISSKMQKTGDFLSGSKNELAKNIGSKLSNGGNILSNGVSKVNNMLNTPQNYFKGFANNALGNGASKVGEYLAGKTGIANTIGNAMTNLGTSLSGSSAATAGAATSGAAAGGTAAGGGTGAAFSNPYTAIAALIAMAAMGTNRKRAKKSGEALMGQTNELTKMATEDAQQQLGSAQQNSTDLLAQSSQNINQELQNGQGIATGYAAPVTAPVQNTQNTSNIAAYQNWLRDNGYSEDVVNGVSQGLNNGHKEIADWISQFNEGEGRNNPINIPTTQEEIELARQGKFNTQTPINSGIEENVRRGLMNKLANGIESFSKGFEENKNTAFKPENMYSDDKKGLMTRLGEGAGTVARALNNPATQALVAGGLSAALTGNPLYGLGMAYKFGNQRAMSEAYRDSLARNGVNVDLGTFGNITKDDHNSLMTPQYKDAANKLAETKLNEQKLYHEMLMKKYYDDLAERKRHNQETEKTQDKKATASMINANRPRVGKGGNVKQSTKATKPQQHPDWGNDLAEYATKITDDRYSGKIPKMKQLFIQKYGVDPDKYIKL